MSDDLLIGPAIISSYETGAAAVGINVTSVSGFGQIGAVSVLSGKFVTVTGVAGAGAVGSLAAQLSNTVLVSGLSATGFVGPVAVTASGSTTVGVTGVAATGQTGSVSIISSAAFTLSGVSAFGEVGTVAIGAPLITTVSGVAGSGHVGVAVVSITIGVNRSFDPATARYHETISDLVVEDDYDLVRDIIGIPSGAVLIQAWFTIKRDERDDDSDAALQKVITPTPVQDVGEIDGGQLVFQLTADETNTLIGDQVYFYDIQVLTDTGKYSTREKGYLIPVGQITDTL